MFELSRQRGNFLKKIMDIREFQVAHVRAWECPLPPEQTEKSTLLLSALETLGCP
jgi:hypothetical protein